MPVSISSRMSRRRRMRRLWQRSPLSRCAASHGNVPPLPISGRLNILPGSSGPFRRRRRILRSPVDRSFTWTPVPPSAAGLGTGFPPPARPASPFSRIPARTMSTGAMPSSARSWPSRRRSWRPSRFGPGLSHLWVERHWLAACSVRPGPGGRSAK